MFVQELVGPGTPLLTSGTAALLGGVCGNFSAEAFEKCLVAEGAWALFFWKSVILIDKVFQV